MRGLVLFVFILAMCVKGQAQETGFQAHHITHMGSHYGDDSVYLVWTYSGADGTYHVQFDGTGGYGTITCSGGTCSPSSSTPLTVSVVVGTPTDRTVLVQESGLITTATFTKVDQEYSVHGGSQSVTGTKNVSLSASATPTPSPSPSGTPGPRCNWQITGTMHSQCASGSVGTHTISLKKNGVVVGEQVIPAGYTNGTIDFNGTDDGGTTVQLVIDGQGGEVHTVICHGDPPPGNWWYADLLLPGLCNQSPTPAPSPSPGATPVPTLTPGPSPPKGSPAPGGSPGPSPGPPTGSPSSVVALSNFNDFYEPIRKAVRDSGNDTPYLMQNKQPLPGVTLDDTKLNEITSDLDGSKEKATTIVDGVETAMDTAREKLSAVDPSSIGSVCSITVPITGWIASELGITSFDIDLCPFSDGITLFRTFVQWTVGFTFFVLTARVLIYDN